MPPLTEVAVNVTGVPVQNGFAEAAMETPAGRLVLTIMVTGVLVAGLFEVQITKDEVQSTVTWSPLVGLYVNAGLLVPELMPFTFH